MGNRYFKEHIATTSFNVETELGPISTVTVSGRIDSTNAHELGTALSTVIDKYGAKSQIIINLSVCEYTSAAGLREIVSALKQITDKKDNKNNLHPIAIIASECVKEVFELAGLDEIFPLVGSVPEAKETLIERNR